MDFSQELQSRISWVLICLVLVAIGMIVLDSIGIKMGNMDLWKWMATHSITALIAYGIGGGKRPKFNDDVNTN